MFFAIFYLLLLLKSTMSSVSSVKSCSTSSYRQEHVPRVMTKNPIESKFLKFESLRREFHSHIIELLFTKNVLWMSLMENAEIKFDIFLKSAVCEESFFPWKEGTFISQKIKIAFSHSIWIWNSLQSNSIYVVCKLKHILLRKRIWCFNFNWKINVGPLAKPNTHFLDRTPRVN
jgi:hypothetical protein